MKKIEINIKQFKDNVMGWIKNSINAFYVAIFIIIMGGISVLAISGLFRTDVENIMVGLGTGIITSALVTFLVDLASKKVEKKRSIRYRRMVLEPLSRASRNLYRCIANRLNIYRMYDENKSYYYFLLPCNDMRVITAYFKRLESLELKSCSEEQNRELNKLIDIDSSWYRALISQYKTLPLETLLLDDVISKEEYNKLKNYTPIETCERNIYELEKNNISEQERYVAAIQLMKISYGIMNKLIFMFDFIGQILLEENDYIKMNLDTTWYSNYYVYSDEYISNEIERSQHPREEHAVLEETEENADMELHNRLMFAIFMDDVDEMKKLFSEIDKNNKIMQKELTSESAKTVMKDKDLRKMYQEKYGMKYVLKK